MTENTSTRETEESQIHIEAGDRLRRAREEAGLSHADITEQLHLSGVIIDDIEQGRVERLPGIYRRGYISNYARLLGLEPESLLGPSPEEEEPPELREVLPVSRTGWKFEQYLKIATYILVTTVIIPPLVYLFIQGGPRIMDREPEAGAVAVEERTDAESSEASDSERALADGGQKDDGEPTHFSASTLPLPAVRPLGKDTVSIRPEEQAVIVPELPESVEAAAGAGVELGIELTQDSWVEIYSADGERLEYDLLRAGDIRTYDAEAPFTLMLGRARAVSLSLEGEPVIYEGHERGDLVRLEITADGEVRR